MLGNKNLSVTNSATLPQKTVFVLKSNIRKHTEARHLPPVSQYHIYAKTTRFLNGPLADSKKITNMVKRLHKSVS